MTLHFLLSQGLSENSTFLPAPSLIRNAFDRIEAAGFDEIVVSDPTGNIAALDLADIALDATHSIHVVLPQCAGKASPLTVAQRMADLPCGRLSLYLREGETGDSAERHEDVIARASEYLTLLAKLWNAEAPISFEGRFFQIKNAFVEKGDCRLKPHIHLSGRSGLALALAGRHADTFHLPDVSADETRRMIALVNGEARANHRGEAVAFASTIVLGATDIGLWRSNILPRLVLARDLGVSRFVFEGFLDEAAITEFGEKVLPALRRSLGDSDEPATRAWTDWALPAQPDPLQ